MNKPSKPFCRRTYITLAVLFILAILIIGYMIKPVCEWPIQWLCAKPQVFTEIENRGECMDFIMQKTSFILSIVGIAVTLLGLFGGFLSIYNVLQSKELSQAIESANKALENQKEIEAQRLIMLGENYVFRHRPKYAQDCFQKVIDLDPSIRTVLYARYEIAALEGDRDKLEKEELNALIGKLEFLIADLENLKSSEISKDEKNSLAGDIRFMQGCILGQFIIKHNGEEVTEEIHQSTEYFRKALRYDCGNVAYYLNLAVSLAIKNDIPGIEEALNNADYWGKQEPLYLNLLDPKNACNLFDPARQFYNEETEQLLIKKGVIS